MANLKFYTCPSNDIMIITLTWDTMPLTNFPNVTPIKCLSIKELTFLFDDRMLPKYNVTATLQVGYKSSYCIVFAKHVVKDHTRSWFAVGYILKIR